MKPPKTIRNFVNTLLGNKKRSKSTPRSVSLVEPSAHVAEVLDRNRKHHRSAEDLLEDDDFEVSRSVSSARTRSLPRRSQSCMNVQRPSQHRREPLYGARVVSGLEGESIHQGRPPQMDDEIPGGGSARSMSRTSSTLPRSASKISRSQSLHSVNCNPPRRTQSNTAPYFEDDRDASLPRTTSWSHPGGRNNNRTQSLEITAGRGSGRMFYDDEETIRSSAGSRLQHVSSRDSENSLRRGRFASHEHLLEEIPRTTSSASSRLTATESNQNFRGNSGATTEEKLKTCLYVLDRLSAQVNEIKNVSKRVENVDSDIKNGRLPPEARERRIRELDMAAAASRRLKSMLKTKSEEASKSRHSSQSSGYDSGGSSRRSSSSPQQIEMDRTARPPSRGAQDRGYPPNSYMRGQYTQYGLPQHPYPQSVSDMMPLWDAKDAAESSQQPKGRNMTREDSMSSGYATGSGSEDGRHESPITTDGDSNASAYSTQPHHPQMRQRQQHPHHPNQQSQHWPAHYYHQGYNPNQYDPYSYNQHQGYHPAMSVDGTVGSENVYGNLEQIYGYASSSLCDNDVYSNGWYQIQVAPQSSDQYSMHSAGGMVQYPDPHTQHQAYAQQWTQQAYTQQQPISMKYGGLADKFYDPSAQPATSVMENISREYATDSSVADDSTWKSYGSFRYRNGQKTVLSTGGRKRKTVRFSQTVRQRVETEESEMEDSTSVIKGCDDDDVESGDNRTSDLGSSDYESSDIYMYPRQAADAQAATHVYDVSNQAVKPLPEPIYEFPSGHIESSCMCGDCILARGTCQMHSAPVAAYY